MAIYAAIGLLGSTPLFAYLSDRYQNRRYPMMGGMLGMAIATFCFANANSYWMLILARTGQGMAGGASWTIGLGMLADVYSPSQLGVVMGSCLMFNTMGFLIGPTLGGTLYEYYGLHAPFAVCAALALLDFFAVVFIAEPDKNKHHIESTVEGSAAADEEAAVESTQEGEHIEEDIENAVTSTKVALGVAAAASGHPEEMIVNEDQYHHHHDQLSHATSAPKYGSIGQATTDDRSTGVPSSSSTGSRPRVGSSVSASSASSNDTLNPTATAKKHPVNPSESDKKTTSDHSNDSNSSPGVDVGYYEIATEWTIVRCMLATLVAASAFSGIEPIFPLHLKDTLGAGPALTGLVFTSSVVPSLLSPLIGYLADRKGRLAVACIGMIMFSTASISLSWPKTIAGFVLPLAFFGLGSSTIQTPLLPAMAHVATTKGWNAYARVYACYNMIYSGGMMIGPILAGLLYDLSGFGWTMVTFGVVGFAMIPIIFGAEIVSLIRLLKHALVGRSQHA
ncbi:hypothetical protein BGW42_006535 [Actinomortierella wolfii]|nr:hypothetical protein BGW42_006535 [Actinomortierella wolfii]